MFTAALFTTEVTGKTPGAGLHKLVESPDATLLGNEKERRTNPGTRWMDLGNTLPGVRSLT